MNYVRNDRGSFFSSQSTIGQADSTMIADGRTGRETHTDTLIITLFPVALFFACGASSTEGKLPPTKKKLLSFRDFPPSTFRTIRHRSGSPTVRNTPGNHSELRDNEIRTTGKDGNTIFSCANSHTTRRRPFRRCDDFRFNTFLAFALRSRCVDFHYFDSSLWCCKFVLAR